MPAITTCMHLGITDRASGSLLNILLRSINQNLLLIWTVGHLCHRRIGVYMKHTVSDGKNLVNDGYEQS